MGRVRVSIYGVTPKWLVYNGKSYQNHLKWMIWGYPYFRKPPCGYGSEIHFHRFVMVELIE